MVSHNEPHVISSIIDPELPGHSGVSTSDWQEQVLKQTPKERWWSGKVVQPVRAEIIDFVIRTAQENPHYTQNQLAQIAQKKFPGERTPAINAINKLMGRCGLRSPKETALLAALEEKWLDGLEWMPDTWWKKLLRRNPTLAERSQETQAPGERVCLAWYPLGNYEGVAYTVHVSVDTYGSFATGEIFSGLEIDRVIELLDRVTLPAYTAAGFRIQKIETKSSSLYTSTNVPCSFAGYLKLRQISHEVRSSYRDHNGYLLKFKHALLPGFILPWRRHLETVRRTRGRRPSPEVASANVHRKLLELREALVSWLSEYNDAPQDGYRNKGRAPREFWKG